MTLTQVMEKATTGMAALGKSITFPSVMWFTDNEKPVVDYDEFVSWESLSKAAVRAPARPLPPEALPPVEVIPLDKQFMRALEAVVREQPDREYHRCHPRFGPGCAAGGTFKYVHEGEGDCIVGKVLIKMGVSAEALSLYEGNGASIVIGQFFGGSHPVDQINRTAQIAMAAQMQNDSRQPWGAAVSAARQVHLALA